MNEIVIYDCLKLTQLVLSCEDAIHQDVYTVIKKKDCWILSSNDGIKPFKLSYGYQLVHRPNTYYSVLILFKKHTSDCYAIYHSQTIAIGNDNSYTVICNDPLIKNFTFEIKDALINTDFPYVYVNQTRYRGFQRLLNGDLIVIGPLKIIYNENFILMNHPNGFEFNLKAINFTNLNCFSSESKIIFVEPKGNYFKDYPSFKYQLSKIKLKELPQNHLHLFGLIQALMMSVGLIAIAGINYTLGKNRGRNELELVQMLVMPLTMLVGSLFLPLMQMLFNRYQECKIQKENQTKIKKLVEDFKKQIVNDRAAYQKYFKQFEFSSASMKRHFATKHFYELEQDDFYFKTINLGQYTLPIQIAYNQNDFNELTNIAIAKMLTQFSDLQGYYLINLNEYRMLDVVGPIDCLKNYGLSLIYNLAVSHNYRDLSIAIVGTHEQLADFYLFKNLQHLYFNQERLFFIDNDDLDILTKLKQALVIFNFGGKLKIKVKDAVIINFAAQNPQTKGCDLLIDLYQNQIFNHRLNRKTTFDYRERLTALEVLIKQLPLYRLRETSVFNNRVITLFDLYGYPLNVSEHYHEVKHPMTIPIGFNELGHRLSFDLSERGLGPHLLIAGATGSGKSELLLGLLLGIALNFDASEANIALIDYKGSGLKEALSDGNVALPHISLSLNNLDTNEFDRSLTAFKTELMRREHLFKQLSEVKKTSIMNLNDYRLNNQENDWPKLSELFIVIDEFAELKKERPTFMHEINRIARVGRSLGFHLILATQKLGGVIDQEINANISTRIALKTNTEEDSLEMIRTKDAYYLEHPGEFYVLSSHGLEYGRAVYTRAYLDPKALQSVAIVDHRLRPLASKQYAHFKEDRQISYFVQEINAYHRALNIKANRIFLEPLHDLTFTDLLSKYKIVKRDKAIFMGEYDD